MGFLNFRAYLAVGVVTGVLLYALGTLIGSDVATFINSFRADAISAGIGRNIAGLVADPLIWVFSGEPLAAILGGLLWPVVLGWFILFVLFVIISFILAGVNQTTTGIGI